MDAANTLHIQLTQHDYLAANLSHARWRRSAWRVGLGIILIGAILLFAYSQDKSAVRSTLAPFAIFVLILVGAITVIRFWIVPRNTRRIWIQQKALQRPHTLTWNDEQMAYESPEAISRTAWSDFLRWRENKDVFMLHFSDVMFRMIPKRAFENEEKIAEFRNLLKQKISPIEGKKRG
jgi:hypothetical protein